MAYSAAKHVAAQGEEEAMEDLEQLRQLARVLRWAARVIEAQVDGRVQRGNARSAGTKTRA